MNQDCNGSLCECEQIETYGIAEHPRLFDETRSASCVTSENSTHTSIRDHPNPCAAQGPQSNPHHPNPLGPQANPCHPNPQGMQPAMSSPVPATIYQIEFLPTHKVCNPSPRPHIHHRGGISKISLNMPIFSIPRTTFPAPSKVTIPVVIDGSKLLRRQLRVQAPDQRQTPAASSTFMHLRIPTVELNHKVLRARLTTAMARDLPPTDLFDDAPNGRT